MNSLFISLSLGLHLVFGSTSTFQRIPSSSYFRHKLWTASLTCEVTNIPRMQRYTLRPWMEIYTAAVYVYIYISLASEMSRNFQTGSRFCPKSLPCFLNFGSHVILGHVYPQKRPTAKALCGSWPHDALRPCDLKASDSKCLVNFMIGSLDPRQGSRNTGEVNV